VFHGAEAKMKTLMDWLVQLNSSSHLSFAVLTVAVMAGLGLAIGTTIELSFKMLGIRYDKIEIEH
jgi:hypothetical protein